MSILPNYRALKSLNRINRNQKEKMWQNETGEKAERWGKKMSNEINFGTTLAIPCYLSHPVHIDVYK
jgi:hypothetical protein